MTPFTKQILFGCALLCAGLLQTTPVFADEVVPPITTPNLSVTVVDANNKVLSGATVKVLESSASGAAVADHRLLAGPNDAMGKTSSIGKIQFSLKPQSAKYYIVASYVGAVVDQMFAQVAITASNQNSKQSITIKLPFTNLFKPTLTVKVVDANNVALPGAEVVAYDSEDSGSPIVDDILKMGPHDASGKTNGNGKISFGLAKRGDEYFVKARYYLPASGWDWNFARVEIEEYTNKVVKIRLALVHAKPNLTIKVVDANDQILPGAEVAVRMSDEEGATIADDIQKAGGHDASGKTNANGKISFGILPQNSLYFVKARYFGTDGWDWGFVKVAVADVGFPQQFKIKLGATNHKPNVIVTVLDADNKPLPGAKVTAFDSENVGASISNDMSKTGYEDASETSKSSGKADFVLPPHQTPYSVKATYAGTEFDWKSKTVEVENLNAGSVYKMTLKLPLVHLKPNVTVTVVDAYGKALSGAQVIVKDGGDQNDPISNDVLKSGAKDATKTTASNGKASFGLTPRTGSYKYYILAKYTGTESDWNAKFLEVPDIEPGHTHAVKLKLGITNLKPNLTVTVVDAKDKPLTGAKVTVYQGDDHLTVSNDITKKGTADASESTKNNGKADFGLLPRSDEYAVAASFQGLVSDIGIAKVSIPDVEPNHKHSVKIKLGFTNLFQRNVTVTVVDANNKPISGAKVVVTDGNGSNASVSDDFLKSGSKDATGLTNTEGKKTFGLVPRTPAYYIVGSVAGTVSDSANAWLSLPQSSDLAKDHPVVIKLTRVNAPKPLSQTELPVMVVEPTASTTTTPPVVGATMPILAPTTIKVPVSVSVQTLGSAILTTGQNSPLEAKVAYSDGTQSYITYQCQWSTSDPTKALVQNSYFYSLSGIGLVDAICQYTEGGQTLIGKTTFTIQLDPALQPTTATTEPVRVFAPSRGR